MRYTQGMKKQPTQNKQTESAHGWSFVLINKRLAELFFERKGNTVYINGYCYVKKSEYKTKREQQQIISDTKKYQITYRNKIFTDKNAPEIKFVLSSFKERVKGPFYPIEKLFKKYNIKDGKTAKKLG